ncbi:MAG: GNAT family N-acetyltransferase [Pseudomonadota bacterium]
MLIKPLTFDSEIFGFPMAAVNTSTLTQETIVEIKKEVKKQKIRFLQYLCSCNDLDNIHQAETSGFHFVDIRLTFQKILSSSDIMPTKKDGIHFGLATPAHIPAIIEMSANLYQDFRFYVDKNFPREKVDAFYHTWLSNAVYGKHDHLCYCLFIDDAPIGYCTIRFTDQHTASLGLFGIASAHQRQSLGNYLLQLTCADLFSKGYKTINVVTQGKNIGAQRTYQSYGFKTTSVEMWYHQWF